MSRTKSYYFLRPLVLLMLAVVAASVMAVVLLASPAHAANYTVSNTADSGAGSLRRAIINANASTSVADTIVFDQSLSGQTITLASELPAITGPAGLTIDGGKAKITISGNNAVGVFVVLSSIGADGNLTLNNLTVANGYVDNRVDGRYMGGAIDNSTHSTLTVRNSTLSGNTAFFGGGIINDGSATLINSTLSGNTATGAGGGILNGNNGTLTLTNSTLSGNSVLSDTGGGGGIDNYGSSNVRNTIVAGNTSTSGTGPDARSSSNTFNSLGHNLIGNTADATGFGSSDLKNLDPLLGPLQNNGGPTDTRALLPGSPAVDTGANSGCPTTDQRGVARPQDGDGNGTVVCDIGAYEGDLTSPKVASTTPSGISVKRGVNPTATFSEKMTSTSVTKSTFKLFKVTSTGSTTQTTNVTVALSSDGLKATLNASNLLAANTKYKAVVTTGARDLAGNQLDQSSTTSGKQQKVWTFKTGSA
jgi:hypothetical protein